MLVAVNYIILIPQRSFSIAQSLRVSATCKENDLIEREYKLLIFCHKIKVKC